MCIEAKIIFVDVKNNKTECKVIGEYYSTSSPRKWSAKNHLYAEQQMVICYKILFKKANQGPMNQTYGKQIGEIGIYIYIYIHYGVYCF